MNMLGHHHVAQQQKLVARPYFVQDSQEQVASAEGAKERKSSIAAAGDEMQMMVAVAALQAIFHRGQGRAPFANLAKGCGTRKRKCRNSSEEALQAELTGVVTSAVPSGQG
jgi:hypothetical protein